MSNPGAGTALPKAVEQVLIEHDGLGENGRVLMNKINSIVTHNPVYSESLR